MEYTKEQCESNITKWRERLDNANPELVVDTWYKTEKYPKAMYFVKELSSSDVIGYGINSDGSWCELQKFVISGDDNKIKATHLEIKAALIKEAKKRGFIFDGYSYPEGGIEHGKLFGWHALQTPKNALFDNGVWTQEMPKHTHKQLEKILGYTFKYK